MTQPDEIEAVGRLLLRYAHCISCSGTGTFDHSSGEGEVEVCIPDDPGRHRYCPCQTCGGIGVAPDAVVALERADLAHLLKR